MNISGVKGLSEGQKAILERLGAIDNLEQGKERREYGAIAS